jgi:hypothetical protein
MYRRLQFRFIERSRSWLGETTHPDVPYITNLRLDPFERTGWPGERVDQLSLTLT